MEDTVVDRSMRSLSAEEIRTLEAQGCLCDSWEQLSVEEPFLPGNYRNVEFAGTVILGSASGTVSLNGGYSRRCGIYNALVNNCRIGPGVYISNVEGGLHRLDIGRGAVIDSVHSIACEGESCFGNDVKVNVLSETGGRDVMISTRLSAPIAYISAMYRHNALLQKKLREMSAAFAASCRSTRCRVGAGAVVRCCGDIVNVEILGNSVIEGALRLSNGTVRNARVGYGVIAENFIVMDDATVESGSQLHGVYAGQGATIASGFCAHDTLVFANSRLENGESAAVFAGPYTTTMHKSTLLIGGLFSFFNAGSGTNQSNHSYKLGPMHQGVMARGCKTGSDIYMLWPAVTGAFSTILGRHYTHPDTREFPFSLLCNDENGRSMLIPAANVKSAGLARDIEKWPARDGRTDRGEGLLDPVNYNWLSPYTIQSVLNGIDRLNELKLSMEMIEKAEVEYKGCIIRGIDVEKALKRYRLLFRLFVGGVLRRRIMSLISTNPEMTPQRLIDELTAADADLQPDEQGPGRWVDMAGLLASRKDVDRHTEDIISGKINSLDLLNDALRRLDDRYYASSWQWLRETLPLRTAPLSPAAVENGAPLVPLSTGAVCALLRLSTEAALKLEEMFVEDASKEFDPSKGSLGFGIDAESTAELLDDFSRVRGSLQGQQFLARLRRRVMTFTATTDNLISLLSAGSKPRE